MTDVFNYGLCKAGLLREEWHSAQLGNESYDEEVAENLVRLVYKRLGTKKTPVIVHCDSPMAALVVQGVVKGKLDHNKWEDIFTGSMSPVESRYDAPSICAGIRLNLQVTQFGGVSWNGTKYSKQPIKLPSLREETVSYSDSMRHNLLVRWVIWGEDGRSRGVNGWSRIKRDIQNQSIDTIMSSSLVGQWVGTVTDYVDQLINMQSAHWSAWFEYLISCDPKNMQKMRGKYLPAILLDKMSSYWVVYNDMCIIVKPPEKVRLDERGRTHCDFGPAIRFADGWSIYSWHGINVPSPWIMKDRPHGLTATKALGLDNIEHRRAACEILGWDVILRELNAKVVDKDPNPQIGTLLSVHLEGMSRSRNDLFLRVQCGTGRTFALPVPPDMQTAREANAWTYGLAANSYEPEVRT